MAVSFELVSLSCETHLFDAAMHCYERMFEIMQCGSCLNGLFLSFTVATPTVTPLEHRVTSGQAGPVTFTVAMMSDSTYQWQFNDADIANVNNKYSGTTDSTLTVMNFEESDDGNYTCIVTTSFGAAVPSQSAQLLVCKYHMYNNL